jgi:hypothetical protein
LRAKMIYMKHLLILSFFLLLQVASFSQVKDHIVYKQEVIPAYQLAIDSGKFAQGIEILNRAKTKYGKLYSEEYLLLAYCYKKVGNNQKAAENLKTCWSEPSYDFSLIKNHKELNNGVIMEGFTKAQQNLVKEGFKNYDERKPSLIDSLQYWAMKMTLKDREARDRPVSPDEDNDHEIRRVNEENSEVLLMYMEVLGEYPGERQMQLFASEYFIVLLHTAEDEAFFGRMKPIFLEEVRKGNMPPSFYAAWVDYHQLYKKLPTVYNTNPLARKQFSEAEVKAIRKNRFELGLIDVDSFYKEILVYDGR